MMSWLPLNSGTKHQGIVVEIIGSCRYRKIKSKRFGYSENATYIAAVLILPKKGSCPVSFGYPFHRVWT
jgi:hypothetical protein